MKSIRDTTSINNDISQETTVAIKHNNSGRALKLCIFICNNLYSYIFLAWKGGSALQHTGSETKQ